MIPESDFFVIEKNKMLIIRCAVPYSPTLFYAAQITLQVSFIFKSKIIIMIY